jgi:protein-disulfide isomerase
MLREAKTIDRLMNGILTLAALVVAGGVLHGSLTRGHGVPAPGSDHLQYVDAWKDILPSGFVIGGAEDAHVRLLVFSDLECPSCRTFHRVVRSTLGERPEDLQAVFISYPLEYHRFALGAARAAECAAEVGAFAEWVDQVYAKQDSLGLKSWASYAADAGISDTTSIEDCARGAGTSARIDATREFGSRIGVEGTPTVLVNGWRFLRPPTKARLNEVIDILLRGDQPQR